MSTTNTLNSRPKLETLNLTTKTIQSTTLSFQSIYNIHRRNSLPASMLSVSHSISNNILKKNLENSTSFFIDQPANTLHTSSASQSSNRRLRDSLNVIAKNLPVSFCSSLTQSLSSLPTA
ncbi:hypothetical protein Hanom_Chr01g00053431 [Helianthus anomalus]